MGITDHALPIHHTDKRHASQLEEIDFLPITQRHLVTGIGQANKRKLMFIPILAECVPLSGPRRQSLHRVS